MEAIFKDKTINLITIASYDDTHYQYIMKCIRHNKNIIVEKPMCLSLGQLKKINASLKKKKSKNYIKLSFKSKRSISQKLKNH